MKSPKIWDHEATLVICWAWMLSRQLKVAINQLINYKYWLRKIPENALKRTGDVILKELKKTYDNAVKPLETMYKYRELSNRHFGDPEIFSKPLVLFMGPWSGGKSTILNYLTENEYTANSIRSGEAKWQISSQNQSTKKLIYRRWAIPSIFQYLNARWQARGYGWHSISCRLDLLGSSEIRRRLIG